MTEKILYGCKTNPIVSLLSRARVEAYDYHWHRIGDDYARKAGLL